MAVFKSVDEYIAAQPAGLQPLLKRLRRTIRKAVPEAEETISYQMPTYLLGGARLLYFAAWRHHYSIYAATEELAAAFGDELAGYRVEKGTIRFPASGPLPEKLIERIAKFRAAEIGGRSAVRRR